MQVIGSTARRLDGDTAIVRTRETNLGDILADAIVDNIAATQFSQVTGVCWVEKAAAATLLEEPGRHPRQRHRGQRRCHPVLTGARQASESGEDDVLEMV